MTRDESMRRRRRAIAFILAGVFPGLGQFYNREPVKGVAFLVVGLVLSGLVGRFMPADPMALAQPAPKLMLAVLVLLAIWLWSLIDAWCVAGRPASPSGP